MNSQAKHPSLEYMDDIGGMNGEFVVYPVELRSTVRRDNQGDLFSDGDFDGSASTKVAGC